MVAGTGGNLSVHLWMLLHCIATNTTMRFSSQPDCFRAGSGMPLSNLQRFDRAAAKAQQPAYNYESFTFFCRAGSGMPLIKLERFDRAAAKAAAAEAGQIDGVSGAGGGGDASDDDDEPLDPSLIALLRKMTLGREAGGAAGARMRLAFCIAACSRMLCAAAPQSRPCLPFRIPGLLLRFSARRRKQRQERHWRGRRPRAATETRWKLVFSLPNH